ncbi:MAG: hypothetical protein RMJ86_10920, partial [Anaerolineae bacterium]|nr:hypothetical protein [Anaerolineae bacterium]
LGSAPTFRTATPAPRWMAHTRLSPLSNAPDAVPPVIVPSTPAPQFVPIASAPPTVVTEVAEAHEQPAFVPSTPAPPPRSAAVSAATDLAERLQQLRQQLREEDRQQIAGTAQREAEKRRFLIPIVIVELE